MSLIERIQRIFTFSPPEIDPEVAREVETSHKKLKEAIHSAKNVSQVVVWRAQRDKDKAERLVESTNEVARLLHGK